MKLINYRAGIVPKSENSKIIFYYLYNSTSYGDLVFRIHTLSILQSNQSDSLGHLT
ncbi:hypothetical protein D791_03243 [Nitrincola nitratireducens]|uniref:Uncharacterized protein n=1 Tax=Nitrincola nitratireducens TaxID=1229521 RepID=W9UR98_9GAMM|nr:hypothetical protein D791_03243 [Nitrincola nitratireducens]